MFCEKCGTLLISGDCPKCSKSLNGENDYPPPFDMDDLRRILGQIDRKKSKKARQIAELWNLDTKQTHQVLKFLQDKGQLPGGEYDNYSQTYTRLWAGVDFTRQVAHLTKILREYYPEYLPTANSYYWALRYNFNYHAKRNAIREALKQEKRRRMKEKPQDSQESP